MESWQHGNVRSLDGPTRMLFRSSKSIVVSYRLKRIISPLMLVATAWLAYPHVQDWLSAWRGWVISVDPQNTSMTVRAGDTIANCSVGIRNISSRRVRIEGVRTTCSCVQVKNSLPMELAAGEHASLELTAYKSLYDSRDTRVSLLLFFDTASPPTGLEIRVQRE